MKLSRQFCPVCVEDSLHKSGACITCKTVSAHTSGGTYMPELTMLQSGNRYRADLARRRGMAKSGVGMKRGLH
ncbi:hypothetical protein UFOVP154_17 [uncultured Caudovirales phage]|uniref:Uncharacterized protein n=1 Tax=uncultured Caudovirales phage TaxID=2100421 RepID=A0A6J7WBZ1_9CAUD|nr:hypothetical protein UFOVP8_2 [uncultured Caudovirales phage]CAB5170317.1 hypothetical protein UFOVP154_17 [uncultured Caudovirales phage]